MLRQLNCPGYEFANDTTTIKENIFDILICTLQTKKKNMNQLYPVQIYANCFVICVSRMWVD